MELIYSRGIYISYLLFFILVNCNERKTEPIFRCGVDTIKSIPKMASNILPIINLTDKRILSNNNNTDEDGFKDFNIYLDLNNFDYELNLYHLEG